METANGGGGGVSTHITSALLHFIYPCSCTMKSDAPQLALPQAVAAAFAPFPGKPRPLPLRARLLRARAWQQRRRPKQRKERRGDGSWPRGVTKGETKVKKHTRKRLNMSALTSVVVSRTERARFAAATLLLRRVAVLPAAAFS